jgi:MFS transporter, DHA2 family, multidrug resistance protein
MDAHTVPGPDQPTATKREWIGLAVLALPTLLMSIDLSVLYLALPALSADLHASSSQQLWSMDIYGFMLAGFLVTMGTLGDRVGRRKLLLIGAAAFTVASVLAAYSDSAGMLITSRALMGVAGATLMPSTLALITNMFSNAKERGVAISLWMSCFLGGMALGPVVGGVMLQNFWWGSVFLLAVPVMVLLLVAGPLLLPEYKDSSHAGPVDLLSVALFLAAILPIIYGLKELARAGWATWPAAAIVSGAIFTVLFVLRQRSLAAPLLDMRLFGNRRFSISLALFLFIGVVQAGSMLLINQYLQMVEGKSALNAGLILVPTSVVMIFSIMTSAGLAAKGKVKGPYLMAGGMTVSAAGYVVLTQLPTFSGVATLLIGYGLVMIGVGPLAALVPEIIVGSAPPEKAGSAASVMNTSGEFGMALGIATIGSIGTAVYRSQMTDAIPAGTPTGVSDAARESIAGAVSAVPQLSPGLAESVLNSAREAFTHAINIVSIIGAAVFVVSAVFAVTALRRASDSAAVAPAEPVVDETAHIEPEQDAA